MARIEPLSILTTRKGTTISNHTPENIDSELYSLIKITPDNTYKNIKSIVGIYVYGKKFSDRYKFSVEDPSPINLLIGQGDNLTDRLRNIYNQLMLSEKHGSLFLNGLSYPGDDERQKFVNGFVAGSALILCVYGIMIQTKEKYYSNNGIENPFYPINLGFPSIEIIPDLLNRQLYNYIQYYIYSSRQKYGLEIKGLGLEWLIQIDNFWEIYDMVFKQRDIRSANNIIGVHISTLGFASYFEERIYQVINNIQELSGNNISLIRETSESLTNEIREVNMGYINSMKELAQKQDTHIKKNAEILSKKFHEFNDVVIEATEEQKTNGNIIKTKLNDHLNKIQDDLSKQMTETWKMQLDEMNKFKEKSIKNFTRIEKNMINRIDNTSNSMINASISKLRSEVENLIDVVLNKKQGVLADLTTFETDMKTQISTQTNKFKENIRQIESHIENKNKQLYDTILSKEKEQTKVADMLIDYIHQTQEDIEETSKKIITEMSITSQDITNKEIHKFIEDESKDLINETITNNMDDVASIIHEKIDEILSVAMKKSYDNIKDYHLKFLNDINKKNNNLMDLVEEIESNKEIIIQQKKQIEILTNKLDQYNDIESIDDKINNIINNRLNNMIEEKLNVILGEEYELIDNIIPNNINSDEQLVNNDNKVIYNINSDEQLENVNSNEQLENVNSNEQLVNVNSDNNIYNKNGEHILTFTDRMKNKINSKLINNIETINYDSEDSKSDTESDFESLESSESIDT